MLEFLIDNIFAMFGGRVFQQTVGISISYAGYKLCSSFRRLVPLISSNSSYYHWVDVTAGGHFVPEDIIPPVAIKCMNLRRSARILARTSPSIKRSVQDGTVDTVSSGTAGVPFSQDTTNNSVVKNHSDSTKKVSETDIIHMLELLINNIFVMLGGRGFQQTVGIHMGTNCASLFADLFLYSYDTDFIQGLLKKNEKKLARYFNFTFRYIDDVLSLNTSRISLIASIPLSFK